MNFDLVRRYIGVDPTAFSALGRLIEGNWVTTTAEAEYDNLEPWIQWVSVHTGRKFVDHAVFRLGDMVDSDSPQIFESIEQAGFLVGAVCPMNAVNRLINPAYFVPDPWTRTRPDASFWSRVLHGAISQAVNDNAKVEISLKSMLFLVLGLLRFGRFRHFPLYLRYILTSRSKPWNRALFLDLLLHDLHLSLYNSKKVDFSCLFLNAGAHIQHHFLLNSVFFKNEGFPRNPEWYIAETADPIADFLHLYNLIVDEYLALADVELLVATGLSQEPNDRPKFYYRLSDHACFLNFLKIPFVSVQPRMTRDFLLVLASEEIARSAEILLRSVVVEGDRLELFGQIENRGQSLFVTLTYPYEITDRTRFLFEGQAFPLRPVVSFVALKNGRHRGLGFAFFTSGVSKFAPAEKSHVCNLGRVIADYFDARL